MPEASSLLCGTSDTLVVLPTLASRIPQANTVLARVAEEGVPYDVLCIVDLDTDTQSEKLATSNAAGRVLLSGEPGGLVQAYNIGFAWFAQGPWLQLVLLEDGVELTPGWLSRLKSVLTAHPECGWVACGHATTPFMPLCSMMSRGCALAVRGLDWAFAPCQFDDGDLAVRCMLAGFAPHGVAHVVGHPEGRTSVPETQRASDLERMHRHRQLFFSRYSLPDSPIPELPVHQPCDLCKE